MLISIFIHVTHPDDGNHPLIPESGQRRQPSFEFCPAITPAPLMTVGIIIEWLCAKSAGLLQADLHSLRLKHLGGVEKKEVTEINNSGRWIFAADIAPKILKRSIVAQKIEMPALIE